MGLLNAILDLKEPIFGVEVLNPFNYQEFAESNQIVLDVRWQDYAGPMLYVETQVLVVCELWERMECCATGWRSKSGIAKEKVIVIRYFDRDSKAITQDYYMSNADRTTLAAELARITKAIETNSAC